MPGVVMEISPKRTFNFDGLAANQNATINIVDRVDVSQWTEGQLMVNVHSEDIGASATMLVEVYADGYTDEDPSVEFTGAAAIATVTLNSSTVAPSYSTAAFSAGFGPLVKVRVKGTMPGSVVSLDAALTIRMCMKSGT